MKTNNQPFFYCNNPYSVPDDWRIALNDTCADMNDRHSELSLAYFDNLADNKLVLNSTPTLIFQDTLQTHHFRRDMSDSIEALRKREAQFYKR